MYIDSLSCFDQFFSKTDFMVESASPEKGLTNALFCPITRANLSISELISRGRPLSASM